MRLIYAFTLILLTNSSCYCQMIDDIIKIGGNGNEVALQSHITTNGYRYTAIVHWSDFTVDSLGSPITILATPNNGNLFAEATLSILQYNNQDRYLSHCSFKFYINKPHNGQYVNYVRPTILMESDAEGNLIIAGNFDGADSTDLVDSQQNLFKRIYNPAIDPTQLVVCKIDTLGHFVWANTLTNKTWHASTDSAARLYQREIHSLTIDNTGITIDIDLFDLYKPYLDTLTLAITNGTETALPINAIDLRLQFDANGNLSQQSEPYLLQTHLGSENITTLNAVSDLTYRYTLIKVNISSPDTLVIDSQKIFVGKGETILLLKSDASGHLVWNQIIGTQNADIFYTPYIGAMVTQNFRLSFDPYQQDILLAFTYYATNFNLTINPTASVGFNYHNIATMRIIPSNGLVKWHSVNGGYPNDEVVSVTPYPPTKGLMLVGKTNSTDLSFGPFSNLNPYGSKNHFAFIFITDSLGNFISGQTINYTLKAIFEGIFLSARESGQSIGSSISYSNGITYITGSFGDTLTIKCKQLIANNRDGFILKLGPYIYPYDTAVCISYPSPSGKYLWDSTGTYTDTLPNAKGCDSIITVYLKVLQTKSVLDSSVCSSMVSHSGKYVWDSTGIYTDTIPNYKGCDSVITVKLTILKSKSVLDSSVCRSMVSHSGRYVWDSTGIYNDTIPNYKGCDSVITLNLKILHTRSTIDTSYCKSLVSPSGKYLWNLSGTYTDTIQNTKACDSIITVRFTRWIDSVHINMSACYSLVSPSGKYTYTLNGLYSDTLPSSKGCDSILFIHFTQQSSNSSVTLNFCDSLVSPSGKNVFYQSGLFMDTIPNHLGCDSVLELSLNYFPLVTQVSSSNDISCDTPYTQLSATAGYTYKWRPTEQLSDATVANPIASLTQTSTVYVTISDSLGCSTTDSVTVAVNKSETIKDLPNVFTPNNDGVNDCISLGSITRLQSVTWQIFNRWGAMVFETTSPDACWDGQTTSGDQAQNGTYYFIIKALSNCGSDIDQHGSIMLIR